MARKLKWIFPLILLFMAGCNSSDNENFLDVTPPSLVINAYAGATTAPARLLNARYGGGGIMTFTWTPSPISGMDVGIPFSEPFTHPVLFDPTTYTQGTYNCNIVFELGSNYLTSTVPVEINVFNTTADPFPGFLFTDIYNCLHVIVPSGTSGIITETFDIFNHSTGTLSWTLTTSQAWLSVSPTNGDTTIEQDTIDVYFDVTGLTEGTYRDVITVDSNSPDLPTESIDVILYVN